MVDKPITDAEFVVLSQICEGPLHGYQIEQQITLRNIGTWTDLSTSSIYYLLGRMEEKGWIEQTTAASDNTPGKPRKVFKATEDGVSVWKNTTLNTPS